MDPYVRFEVTRPSHLADTAVQKSSNKDNEENPEWEEQLSFLVDEREPGQLQMTLWDANYVFDSQMSEPVSIELDQLPVGGDYQRRTVKIHVSHFHYHYFGGIESRRGMWLAFVDHWRNRNLSSDDEVCMNRLSICE